MKSRSGNPVETARIARDRPDNCPPGPSPIDAAEPLAALDDSDDPSDLDDLDPMAAATMNDDPRWDVFILDDDERDPLPDPSDFWGSREHGAVSEEPD